MNAREYLERPGKLKQEILADQDNIAAMRSVVEQCTTHLSLTAGCNPSKNKDSFENVMLDITKAEADLETKIMRYEELCLETIKQIGSLHDSAQRQLLRLRYLDYQEWENIAKAVGVSEGHIYVLHRKALKNLEKLLVKDS